MKVLTILTSSVADATKVSVPIHLAVNGGVEIGDEAALVLAGDATDLLVGDAIETAEGVGVPPLRALVAKLREHEIPVYV